MRAEAAAGKPLGRWGPSVVPAVRPPSSSPQLYTIMSFSSVLSFEMDALQPTCLVPSWWVRSSLQAYGPAHPHELMCRGQQPANSPLAAYLRRRVTLSVPLCPRTHRGYTHNLVVQLLLPIMMLIFVLVWCGLTYVMYRIKMIGMTRSVKAATSQKLAEEAAWKQVLYSVLDVPTGEKACCGHLGVC
jgi:hypothetical protein